MVKYFKNRKIITFDIFTGVAGKSIEPVFLGLYLIVMCFKRQISNLKFCLFFIILLLHGIIMSFFTGYDVSKVFQQTFLLFIVVFGYLQIYNNKVPVEKVFSVYLKYVYVLAVLGLFQYATYIILGVNLFPYTLDGLATQDGDRLHSVFLEPGSVAAFFSPAITYIVVSKSYYKRRIKQSLLIILAYLLTFTSAAILCLLLALIFRYYERLKRYKVVFIILFVSLVCGLLSIDYASRTYSNADNAIDRATGKISESMVAIEVLTSSNSSPYMFEGLNESSYAQLTNTWVALNAPYRFLGTGIGTHQQNYESSYRSNYKAYGLNEDDAYSLFSRLLSEFGYVGLTLYLLFVYKSFNKKNILSCCFLVFIISYLVKGGHYTLYCTALFHVLYYKCKKRGIDENLILGKNIMP